MVKQSYILTTGVSVHTTPSAPSTPPAVVATCPDGWVRRNNFCYYFSTSPEKQSFATTKCHNMSSALASIHDAEENAFVAKTLVLYLIIPHTTKL